MFGVATINPIAIGIPKKSKKFIVFSIASFSLSSEVVESFEKTGYMMFIITMLGKKPIISVIRDAAPYKPTTVLFAISERRTVSMLV